MVAVSGGVDGVTVTNILQQDTTVKETIRGKRLRAGWDESLLDAIYAGIRRK
jgi:hypothetical protein